MRKDKQNTLYVIHRTSIGCYERTLALLLEKYAGGIANMADAGTSTRIANQRPFD